MEITEEQVFEALGLGENERGPADPAPEEEPADPAIAEEPAGDDASGDEEPEGHGDEPEEQGGKPAMTPEERREHAAQRRRAEQQAAIDAAVQSAVKAEQEKARQAMADFFERAGLKNNITGQPIRTTEEYDQWKQAFDAQKLDRDLKAGKLTKEGLDAAIESHPAVRQAREMVAQQEAARRQQDEAAAKARVDADLAEIRKMDPTINTVEDLLKMPNAKEFYGFVKQGNSFLNAFRLANWDRLEQQRVEAARRQAAVNTRGKEHLTGTDAVRGKGSVSVPAEEMELFRQLNPEASEDEIRAYYNKHKK